MSADEIRPAMTPEEWAEWWETGGLAEPFCYRGELGMLVGAKLSAYGRHTVAALCLDGQPFGFTREDLRILECVSAPMAEWDEDFALSEYVRADIRRVAAKIRALLPPTTIEGAL